MSRPDGFALLRGPLGGGSGPQTFTMVELALDGTSLSERTFTGMEATLAGDDTRLLLALRVDTIGTAKADSVIWLVQTDRGGRVEIARQEMTRQTMKRCDAPDEY